MQPPKPLPQIPVRPQPLVGVPKVGPPQPQPLVAVPKAVLIPPDKRPHDLYQSRLNILYFLSNLEAGMHSQLGLGNFVNTEPLQDLKKAGKILIAKAPQSIKDPAKGKLKEAKSYISKKGKAAKETLKSHESVQPIKKLASETVESGKEWTSEKVQSAKEALHPIKEAISERLDSFEISKWIKETYVDHLRTSLLNHYEDADPEFKNLVEGICNYLLNDFAPDLAEAAPGWGYYTKAVDIYSALKKAGKGVWSGGEQLVSGWGVEIEEGTPSIIAEALAKHTTKVIAVSVGTVAYKGVALTVHAVGDTHGVGTPIMMITGLMAEMVNLIDNVVQLWFLNRCFHSAKELLQGHQMVASELTLHSAEPFYKWLRKQVKWTPILAGLIMACGIAGKPKTFLKQFKKDGSIVTDGELGKGEIHMTTLKNQSVKYVKTYVKECEISFHSHDKFVQARLEAVLNGVGCTNANFIDSLPKPQGQAAFNGVPVIHNNQDLWLGEDRRGINQDLWLGEDRRGI